VSRYVISDLHFGHENILKFKDGDKPMRVFDSIEHMHEIVITNWNKVIHEKDTVYVLGDVAMPRRGISVMEQLKGRKVLIKGNHDLFPLKDYLPYFDDIRGCHIIDNRAIMTHIPIHPDCLGRFKVNIHGHLHTHVVTEEKYVHYPKEFCYRPEAVPDKRYINVCVEQTGYTPVLIDDILKDQP
jgi:calcineurin-like phosphoesterase family protein